ncbi:hypothetical protein QBC32DRAFT_336254 [Pseudoneurospora amorphoporcata]|uniref:Uncharacterized protein n=1 Tax=Pseudoneurospora amorphoporcata TaxID=241081 RepID=A0AAN6SIA6_9PEZI|nr:hypothetical protein QBC32DRAFT_336254 [Pseudoneurospora amorphoporcata]
MSRPPRTLTNTDLAFLLCTLAATSQFPKASLSFETDYGLILSLEPDGSINISLRKPTEPEKQCSNPFDTATPIKSQQLFVFSPSNSGIGLNNGSIDGVLRSPLGLGTGTGTGMGGASITPPRSTPSARSAVSTPTRLGGTSSRAQTHRQRNKITSNTNSPKIQYYIRPGIDAINSSHMYYTAASPEPHPQSQPQPRPQPQPQPKIRLHRVKLSHLQSLYHHHPSTSASKSSNSWFDSYLDWIDRLEDALTQQRQRQDEQPTPCTAISLSPIRRPQAKEEKGPFTDSGEESLWLVEGLLLASWLSLQEGVDGVEYLPLAESEVYRLEPAGMDGMEDEAVVIGNMERKGSVNNAGVMMGRLLEVIRAGTGE